MGCPLEVARPAAPSRLCSRDVLAQKYEHAPRDNKFGAPWHKLAVTAPRSRIHALHRSWRFLCWPTVIRPPPEKEHLARLQINGWSPPDGPWHGLCSGGMRNEQCVTQNYYRQCDRIVRARAARSLSQCQSRALTQPMLEGAQLRAAALRGLLALRARALG
jgi:hypothetical protein